MDAKRLPEPSPRYRTLRVLIVSGIFPPDVGGPATHSVLLRDELIKRGHKVGVLTLTDGPKVHRTESMVRFPRQWPWPVRLFVITAWFLRRRFSYDIVYSTGMGFEAVFASRLARLPSVLKVVGDQVWERSRRLGLTTSEFDEFQRTTSHSFRILLMRWFRNWAVLHASVVIAPSRFLQRTVEAWVSQPGRVTVVPNGVVVPHHRTEQLLPRDRLRIVSMGRLVSHKRIELILEAVAAVNDLDVLIIGEGPERDRLEQISTRLGLDKRIRFTGAFSHDQVTSELARSDALVSASSYEGLPHVVLEALACGVPVIATSAGGTDEAVIDGFNGLIVPEATSAQLASALRRFTLDPDLRARLADGAKTSGREWRFSATADALEQLLARTVGGRARAIFFGRGFTSGQDGPQALTVIRKLEIICSSMDCTVITSGAPPISTTRASFVRIPRLPLVDIPFFYLAGASVAILLAITRKGTAIVCQSPFEGFGVAVLSRFIPKPWRPKTVIELHGDWKTATRSYGPARRRLLAPIADLLSSWTIRRADRVRVVSAHLENMAREVGFTGYVDRFPAYVDLEEFLRDPVSPVPPHPSALFLGSLVEAKGLDLLIEAWRSVAGQISDATLIVAGDGPLRARMLDLTKQLNLTSRVIFLGHISHDKVKVLLDSVRLLVVPSRSEGLGRVILEAFARGRPVVASDVGGIPELVIEGVNGYLISPNDDGQLAARILSLLIDEEAIRTLGLNGRSKVENVDPQEEFRAGISRLAEWIHQA